MASLQVGGGAGLGHTGQGAQDSRYFGLGGSEVEAFLGQQRAVKVDLQVLEVEHPGAGAVTAGKPALHRIAHGGDAHATSGQAVLLEEAHGVGRAVVGGEEHQGLALAHGFVELGKQAGNVAVEAQVGVFGFDGVGAELVAYVVGAGEAHGQQVGDAGALAHLLGVQGFDGKVGGEAVAEGRAAYQVEVLGRGFGRSFAGGFLQGSHRGHGRSTQHGQVVGEGGRGFALEGIFPGHVVGSTFGILGQGQQRLPRLAEVLRRAALGIKLVHPLGQLWQVEGAADEGPVLAVVPVGGVAAVAGRQDAAPVLHAKADDLALEVGGQPQLVADGGAQQMARRLLPGRHRAAHRLHSLVLGYVGAFAFFAHPPIVADNAVGRGRGPGVDAGVARPGVGRHVVVVGVLEAEALAQQPLETVAAKLCPVAVEVVVAHLVNHNTHHQLGTGDGFAGLLAEDGNGQQRRQRKG